MADPLISETRREPVYANLREMFALLMCPGSVRTKTTTGNLTLDATYPTLVSLTLDAARTITLDTIASASGCWRLLHNVTTAAAYLMTVNNPAAAAVGYVRAGEIGLYYCDGTAWSLVHTIPTSKVIAGASTAAAGTDSTNAGVLPAGTSSAYPTSAADGTKGVRIHANDDVIGRVIEVHNVAAAVLKVYPPVGGTINGGGVDASVSSVSGHGVRLLCTAALTWIVLN